MQETQNTYKINYLLGHNTMLNKFQNLKSYWLYFLNTEKLSREPIQKVKIKVIIKIIKSLELSNNKKLLNL